MEVLPLYEGGGIEEFRWLDLADGRGFRVDRLRREPLELRLRVLDDNLFEIVGRPTDPAAVPGEIHLLPIRSGSGMRAVLFAEASTGYVAYFEDYDRDGWGQPKVTLGRPFEALRAGDGNFALLPRRDGSGRTQGAYLYHATTGRTLYAAELAGLELDPPVTQVEGLPTLTGRVTATPLEIDDGETVGYLLLDGGDLSIYRLSLADPSNPARLGVARLDLDLSSVFPAETSMPAGERRFAAVPLNVGEVTRSVLLIDGASGKLARIENPGGGGEDPTALVPLRLELGELGPGSLDAVPNLSGSGNTAGAWVLVGSPPRAIYLGGLDDPSTATAAPVRTER